MTMTSFNAIGGPVDGRRRWTIRPVHWPLFAVTFTVALVFALIAATIMCCAYVGGKHFD